MSLRDFEILANYYRKHLERTERALATIKKGNVVKIVECAEARLNEGKTFQVLSDAYRVGDNFCVVIANKGPFDIACLEKV